MKRPKLSRVLLVLAALGLAIQLVPYGWNHANPAVAAEPKWDKPRTRELFFRACADCHSNETKWPLYSRIAPVSWLVYNDIQEGREHLNVSEWNRPQKDAHEPGSGSDAFGSMKSTARRDGDDYILNGSKTFITNGPYADTIVFICKFDEGTLITISFFTFT